MFSLAGETVRRILRPPYLEFAQALIGADLALMDPSFSGDRSVAGIVRATKEAELNRYETEHASVMEEEAA